MCITGKLFQDEYGQMLLIKQETPRSGKTAFALGERSRTENYDLDRKELKSLLKRFTGNGAFKALEQRAYKVDHDISGSLRSVAERMGFLKARPRDVVKLHSTALQRKTSDVPSGKARAYLEEGRIMVLELMGYLSSFYRNSAFRAVQVYSPEVKRKKEEM